MVINGLILVNFCGQETPGKLHNSTTGCCYLLQTKVKLKSDAGDAVHILYSQSSQSAQC